MRDIFVYTLTDASNEDDTLSVLCCGNCSCDDDCWKTASCCPDKDSISEHSSMTCKSPVVKPFPKKAPGNLGYFVIDSCLPFEKNATLISKCIARKKTELKDYIWVYDALDGLTYQNEYCALCNHVYDFIPWQLNSKCSHVPPNLEKVLVSNNCRLALESPVNVSLEICLIADYTHCNESGAWASYNADIEMACNSYHSIYFAQVSMPEGIYDKSFRNVFCYNCNKDHRSPTEPVCNISADFIKVRKCRLHRSML